MPSSFVYILLSLSIIAEVFAATMLKLSEGFTNVLPLLGVAIGYGLSFGLLGIILKYKPISIVYAIWAGVGTVLTAVVSMLYFDEVFTTLKIAGIVIVIAGIVVLNMDNEKTNVE